MEAAQTRLWRAVRREVSRTSRVGPSDSSAASVSSGDDVNAGLSAEFIDTAHAVNAALARAVADEVEEQLTDVLMCLGEESTKARILEHALTRFDIHVPRLLREAGYSPENSPREGSRGASPAARDFDAAARDSPFSGSIPGDGDDRPAYARLLSPQMARSRENGRKAARDEGVSPELGLAARCAPRLGARGASEGNAEEAPSPPFETVASSGRGLATARSDGFDHSRALPTPAAAVAARTRVRVSASAASRRALDPSARRRDRRRAVSETDVAARSTADDHLPHHPRATTRLVALAEAPTSNAANAVGTAPEEEGSRPSSVSRDGDASEEDEDDLGDASSSSEASRGGGGGGGGTAACAADAPEDAREVSRRARQRARARLEVGPGVGPNILEGYYGRDGRRGADAGRPEATNPARDETARASVPTRAAALFGVVADDDGESGSVLFGERGVPNEGSAPGVRSPPRGSPGDAARDAAGDVGATFFRGVAATVRAAARVARPALMTTPVRQRHWMEIYESSL